VLVKGLGVGRGEATRLMRWLVAVTATVAVFGVCLWLFRFASWSWMPHATSDRWAVAAAFASITAGAVGAADAWWASREIQAQLPAGVVSATDHAVAAGQDVNISASSGGVAAGVIHGNVAPPGPPRQGPANS